MSWFRKFFRDLRDSLRACTSSGDQPPPGAKPTPKPDSDPSPEPKPDVKPDPTPAPEPTPVPEPKPEVKPTDPVPEPKPEVKPTDPVPEPKPEVKPSDPEPDPTPVEPKDPEPKPEPVEPEPVPEPEPKPVDPEPTPEPEPEPKPVDPEPEPKPDTNPGAVPDPPQPDLVDPDPIPPVEPDPIKPEISPDDHGPGPFDPPTEESLENIDPPDESDHLGEGIKVRMHRITTLIDTRPGNPTHPGETRPETTSGELYEDRDFTKYSAFETSQSVDWKRPGEIASNPCLYSDGTTRFDIEQGNLGSCWFLAVVSAIADKREILDQIIPKDAYRIGTPEYDGVFHCRFWRFGEWVDVYTDDYLPVIPRTNLPWGSRSKDDQNEMWVSLLEKAFAKFLGTYDAAHGGWAGDAFISLTGGIAENFTLTEHQAEELYRRMKHAFDSGSVVICGVPKENDGKMGLVGGHAYTMTGVAVVIPMGSSLQQPLVRVRNPWGGRKGEWQGPYSDDSSSWDRIGESTKSRLNVENRGDGEFWMSLYDVYRYCDEIQICSFTPDFDEDGKTDGLDTVTSILGEWKGQSAAGSEEERKINNPRFLFTVKDDEVEEDGMIPFVLQFFQYREDRHANLKAYIRADLYRVEKQFLNSSLVLNEITNYKTYFKGFNLSYRYRLSPGEYVILPHTMESDNESEFLLRLFSSVDLPCRELIEDPSVFWRKYDPSTLLINGKAPEISNIQHYYGAWKAGKNAGGQVRYKSFADNPQYSFSVSGFQTTPVMLSLKQLVDANRLAIGVKLYRTSDRVTSPLDIRYLWNNYSSGTVDTVQGHTIFIMSYEGADMYMLQPGNYVAVLFLENPNEEKSYVLSLGSENGVEISVSGMNVED